MLWAAGYTRTGAMEARGTQGNWTNSSKLVLAPNTTAAMAAHQERALARDSRQILRSHPGIPGTVTTGVDEQESGEGLWGWFVVVVENRERAAAGVLIQPADQGFFDYRQGA